MTEQELLEMVRQDVTERKRPDAEARKKTAKRCRECYAENEPARETCARCGRALAARFQPGKAVSCPESGETEQASCFAIRVGRERRALLGPGGRLVVGRGETADVWLEASIVSRAHVEIAWEEGAAHPNFRDLGSSNGTRHRGLLRAEGLLGDGDVLEIGPYQVVIERDTRPAPTEAPGETADDFDTLFDKGPELQGPLGRGTTSTLLRGLSAAGRTGTFEVALERGTGSVVLAAGRVVSARCGRTVGLAALHLILCAESGAYRFVRTFEIDDGEAVDLTVEQVLAAVPV